MPRVPLQNGFAYANLRRRGGGPEEGSYSICIKCAVLLVFNADLSVHIATDKEMSELQTNAKEAFSKLKMAQRYILHQTRKN